MKKLLKRHYQSIVNRGLITEETTFYDFISKLDEEILELNDSYTDKEVYHEAIDCICVLSNMLIHFGVDIEKELIKNIETQEKRANEATN